MRGYEVSRGQFAEISSVLKIKKVAIFSPAIILKNHGSELGNVFMAYANFAGIK